MFGHSSFNRDPFRHLPLPFAFSYADYIAPPHINYPRAHHNRHVPPPLLPHRHRDYAPHRRREFHFEHYPSSCPSDTAHSVEDAYYHSSSETNSSLIPPPAQPVLHARSSSSSHKRKKEKEEQGDVVIPTFQHKTIALPATSPLNLPFTHFPPSPSSPTVLILPKTLTLTHLRIHLTTPSPCPTPSPSTATTLHATVASEMRLRDVIRQLLGPGVRLQGADARAYVRVRGQWQEPGDSVRVCEVVDKVGRRGEVEVWVDVRGGRSERKKGGSGDGRVMGWETERGGVGVYGVSSWIINPKSLLGLFVRSRERGLMRIKVEIEVENIVEHTRKEVADTFDFTPALLHTVRPPRHRGLLRSSPNKNAEALI